MRHEARWLQACGALAILAGCAGCGDALPPQGPAQGRVLLKSGQPLAAGRVTFVDRTRGLSFETPVNPDGSFALETADGAGLPLGNYKVAVLPPEIVHPLGPINVPPPKATDHPEIPPKYRDPETSGWTAKVETGGGKLEFKLQ